MSVISTGNFAKMLWPGLKAIWGTDYDEHPREYTDIMDVVSSDKAYEEYVQRKGLGLVPIKPEGQGITYDSETQGYTTRATNVSFGLGFILTEEAMEDNLYKKQGITNTQDLAFSLRQTEENVAANLYNRGFNSAYVFGDGKEWFATDHPTSNGVQSNELATPADLSEASLEDVLIQIMNATNDRGLKISLMGQTLCVAPANLFNATRIVKSALRSGTDNNDINAIPTLGVLPGGVRVNHYFTDPTAWFVRTNLPKGRGAIFQNRKAALFRQDDDFDTSNLKYKVNRRFTTSVVDWRGAYGSAGA